MRYFSSLIVCCLLFTNCKEHPCDNNYCNGTITFWTDEVMCDCYNDGALAEYGNKWEIRLVEGGSWGEIIKTFYPCNHVQNSEPDCNDGFFNYHFEWSPNSNSHTIKYVIRASTIVNGVSNGNGSIGTCAGTRSITVTLDDDCGVARIY